MSGEHALAARWGAFVARHRWAFAGAWLVVVVAAAVLGAGTPRLLSPASFAADTEASRAADLVRREFPELFGGTARGRRGRGARTAAQDSSAQPARRGRRRGRKPMSASARKAVSERMRKYWAERRKAKGGK